MDRTRQISNQTEAAANTTAKPPEDLPKAGDHCRAVKTKKNKARAAEAAQVHSLSVTRPTQRVQRLPGSAALLAPAWARAMPRLARMSGSRGASCSARR